MNGWIWSLSKILAKHLRLTKPVYKPKFVAKYPKRKLKSLSKRTFCSGPAVSLELSADLTFWVAAGAVGQMVSTEGSILGELAFAKRASWFYNNCFSNFFWYVFVLFCLFFDSDMFLLQEGGWFFSSHFWSLVDYRVLNSLEVLSKVPSFDLLIFHNLIVILI